jgi:hypothetical protein
VGALWIGVLEVDWDPTWGRGAGASGGGLSTFPTSDPLAFGVMTQTEVLLAAAIAAGFLLLLATAGAFALKRQTLGLTVLVLAGATFVAALVLMARVSTHHQDEERAAVEAKYHVTIQEWGAPLGSAPVWEVDGKEVDCVADLDDRDDPVVVCDGEELPKR